MNISFKFPDNLQRNMLFDSLESITNYIKQEAINRNLPQFLFRKRSGDNQNHRADFTCRLCKARLNFTKLNDKWRVRTIRNQHNHEQHPERVFLSNYRKQLLLNGKIGQESYKYPNTVTLGMEFSSKEEIGDVLDREASERGLLERVYRYQKKRNGLNLYCKICQVSINFAKVENGYKATDVNSQHTHGPKQLEQYRKRSERRRQLYRDRRANEREQPSFQPEIFSETSQSAAVLIGVGASKVLKVQPEWGGWQEKSSKRPDTDKQIDSPVHMLNEHMPAGTRVDPPMQSPDCWYITQTEGDIPQELYDSLLIATHEIMQNYADHLNIRFSIFENVQDPIINTRQMCSPEIPATQLGTVISKPEEPIVKIQAEETQPSNRIVKPSCQEGCGRICRPM